MERKLATVVKIADLNPISGADAIEAASVKGWKVVVKRAHFYKYLDESLGNL